MTNVDFVVFGATGIVLYNAEVIFCIVQFVKSGECFEFLGTSLLFYIGKVTDTCPAFGGAWIFTGKLEGVLDCATLLASITTLRNLSVVSLLQERRGVETIFNPDVDNGKFGVSHALGEEFSLDHTFHVLFFQTFGFSKVSVVVFGEDARRGTCKCILYLETYVCTVLKRDFDRNIGVHGFSLVCQEDGI